MRVRNFKPSELTHTLCSPDDVDVKTRLTSSLVSHPNLVPSSKTSPLPSPVEQAVQEAVGHISHERVIAVDCEVRMCDKGLVEGEG